MATLIDKSACTVTQNVCERYENKAQYLIEILHEIQVQKGYISEACIEALAKCLNRTRAEMLGVVSFYHDFHTNSPPATSIQICRAEACQARGCAQLIANAETKFGTRMDAPPNANGLALRSAFCLGNCARGPAIMIGHTLYGDVSLEKLERILAAKSS